MKLELSPPVWAESGRPLLALVLFVLNGHANIGLSLLVAAANTESIRIQGSDRMWAKEFHRAPNRAARLAHSMATLKCIIGQLPLCAWRQAQSERVRAGQEKCRQYRADDTSARLARKHHCGAINTT